MQFEYQEKQYNFRKIEDTYLSAFETEEQWSGNYDQDGDKITNKISSDLYMVKFQDEETGLICTAQAGLDLNFTEKDYEINNQDTVLDFDYSECTLPDHFDEDDFEREFGIVAEKQASILLLKKVENDEIPEVVEAIGSQLKEEKPNRKAKMRIR
ncbi:hypothetical protein D6L40_01560 [Vibrio alginolyticus]|uniref:hypothetical protein n=1 Tax=Vibrio TaxID=662 RepID=UPI00045363E6|nr:MULTISPECIES: hypothetical protein [Vibrio]EGQ9368321.1 hypothetical protein [Vibrio parahaemolyticus]EGR1570178.1 hypothetical protein [Vibrio alginolyticus]EVT81270.1 hypothetical protein D032_0599 [Vibrio parahaemolyticus V14/01]MDW1941500.1 hypothetical protein [Vibrio sp. Vb0599]HCE2329688.1 hypothetical protein [Vibrio parahaemolyticus]